MKAVILAGGLGTRISEETHLKPKPMIEIGGKPILWHIMKTYSTYNIKDFIVCAGYKSEVIKDYFLNYKSRNFDYSVNTLSNEVKYFGASDDNWNVTVSDTGELTNTGGRIFKVRDYVKSDIFMCTYGDGLADVDIQELLKFHKSHGKLATVTAVRPVSRFGVLEMDEKGNVESFQEKPQSEGWINAGYFVFEPKIFEYLDGNSILEREPMANLANDGQLVAFKHGGFFQPMDTYREMSLLNELWDKGQAPWKVWK
jgi:glucose-1-phosphate cytidylyltransferase